MSAMYSVNMYVMEHTDVSTYIRALLACTVLEIRNKWCMDKCPSIIILDQTISALFGHIFGGVPHVPQKSGTTSVADNMHT